MRVTLGGGSRADRLDLIDGSFGLYGMPMLCDCRFRSFKFRFSSIDFPVFTAADFMLSTVPVDHQISLYRDTIR